VRLALRRPGAKSSGSGNKTSTRKRSGASADGGVQRTFIATDAKQASKAKKLYLPDAANRAAGAVTEQAQKKARMPETSARDSDTEGQAQADLQADSNVSPVSNGAGFARTWKALAELGRAFRKFGRALRDDAAVATRPLAKRLRVHIIDAWRRLRGIDFSTVKLRATELVGRPAVIWSPRKHRRARSAYMKFAQSAQGNQRRWRTVLLRSAAAAGAGCLVLLVVIFSWALNDVPWDEIADGSLKPVVVLETADGKPLVSEGPIQGPYAKREDFPKQLIDAVLTSEDRHFYEHPGIDLKGILRAIYKNLGAGEVVQGGSTITQQLVKILYLERDRTWKRKIQEAVIAFWLEQKLGKNEILTRYLNNIYLGGGATGVPAAARIYFDKDVRDLNLGESAMLAGIIRAPSQLNPINNPDGARRQAGLVLDAMATSGKTTADQAKAATAQFAELHPHNPTARLGSWFADWAMQDARELAGPYKGTFAVKTTMVPQLQALAEKVVAEALDREGAEAGASQAALVAMTPQGAVVAMVGGRDYAKSAFNRAATAMRQPGSAFKLFVYYAALKAGLTPGDWIDDAPIEVNGWSPENYGGGYRGKVSIAEAFARSLNAATVALAMEIGIDKVIAAARELGIDARLVDTQSLALGSSEMNLLDLTGAYASVRAGSGRALGHRLLPCRRAATRLPRWTARAAFCRSSPISAEHGRSAPTRRRARDGSRSQAWHVCCRKDRHQPKSSGCLVCRLHRAARRGRLGRQ
jgi:penicillin-binding protein 1A